MKQAIEVVVCRVETEITPEQLQSATLAAADTMKQAVEKVMSIPIFGGEFFGLIEPS